MKKKNSVWKKWKHRERKTAWKRSTTDCQYASRNDHKLGHKGFKLYSVLVIVTSQIYRRHIDIISCQIFIKAISSTSFSTIHWNSMMLGSNMVDKERQSNANICRYWKFCSAWFLFELSLKFFAENSFPIKTCPNTNIFDIITYYFTTYIELILTKISQVNPY